MFKLFHKQRSLHLQILKRNILFIIRETFDYNFWIYYFIKKEIII